jgi:hypothetical protein
VALPVALLSLIAVTILVTSVLLSSSTEGVLSIAHQDATRGLFNAEGAIEAYIAQSQLTLEQKNVRYLPPGGSVRDSVLLAVSVLGEYPSPIQGFPNDFVFSVAATPVRGGRRVVAMIHKVNAPINMNVEGGLISGDDVNAKGNSTISDGSDSKICADSVGGKAIQTTPGNTTTTGNNVKVIGENEQINLPKEELVQHLFGTTLQELIKSADIKFPRGQFGNTHITSGGGVANKTNPQLTPYNWGCPADVFGSYGNGSSSEVWTTACVLDGDETHLPLVVIDASNADGSWGKVNANLSHGQGMLIIYNGDFTVAGNFAYKGVILVEGNFDIRASGGGATTPKIEGAVIGLGMGPNSGSSKIDDDITGSPTIRYNRCAINMLRSSWETTKPFLRMGGRTFGWFEVVR